MKRFAALCSASLLFLASNAMAVGAIAVDKADSSKEPAYGFSINQPDQRTAERVAVQYCRQYGGSNCQAIVWFQTCGAYANSKRYYGYGYGATKDKAVRDALNMCQSDHCKIVVAQCQ